MRYPYELRDSAEYFHDIPNVKINPDSLRLAEHILQSKTAPFDPARFVDRYEEAVIQIDRRQAQGHAGQRDPLGRRTALHVRPDGRPEAQPGNLDSPGQRRQARQGGSRAQPKPRVKGQGELLLPIQGAKGKSAPEAKPASRRKAG